MNKTIPTDKVLELKKKKKKVEREQLSATLVCIILV